MFIGPVGQCSAFVHIERVIFFVHAELLYLCLGVSVRNAVTGHPTNWFGIIPFAAADAPCKLRPLPGNKCGNCFTPNVLHAYVCVCEGFYVSYFSV